MHTQTVLTDNVTVLPKFKTKIFGEVKCLKSAFDGRERIWVSEVLGKIAPDVGTEVW